MDTLVADNFIFDQTLDKTVPDSDRVVFKQKNLTPFIDQARGGSEYVSGRVIIDAQGFGNSSEIPDWANAYITVPEVETLTAQTGVADLAVSSFNQSYMTAPKNNSLVESLRVEQGGNMIVSESQNLSHLVNFVKHCTTSADETAKHGADSLYAPDSVGNWTATPGVLGIANVANDPLNTDITGPERVNEGLLKRQRLAFPLNKVGSNGILNDAACHLNEEGSYQAVPLGSTKTITYASETTLSEIHRLRVVRLADLSDYFAKHPLVRGCDYKLTLSLNQGTSTVSWSATTASNPFSVLTGASVSTSLVGGATCMPSMLCVGPNTIAAKATATVGSTTTLTLKLTSKVDISSNARQQGIILWVPSYIPTEEYEAKLLATPQVYRTPFKITSSVFTGLTANAPIGLQLFTAISNPRALIVMPQYAQEAQTQPSQQSPFNPSPGCTDPTLSLTKVQIRVNSRQMLPSPQSYSFQQFIENTARIFAVNGGLSSVSSGNIDFWKFMHNYRYYAYDISAIDESQRDVPQIISLEAFNNNKVKLDLYVFCLSEQGAIFDMVKGGVQLN